MGLRGLVVLASSHTLPFFFSPFCARLASQRSRFRFSVSFDWNEEVMGESRRVCME